jgi:predicted HD phosphohydrolase
MDSGTVSFTRMEDGTKEEYDLLYGLWHQKHCVALADTILEQLKTLQGDKLGYKIDRYQHSLQTASRTMRDGADEETIVCALLHDVADALSPENHSEAAAAILKPYVSADNYWLVKHHGVFQGYYFFHHYGMDRNAREEYRGHPMFEKTAQFCERWDQNSFDPDYDTMPLSAFEPMVRRIFSRRPFGQPFGE